MKKLYSYKIIAVLFIIPFLVNWVFLLFFGKPYLFIFMPKYILHPLISGFYTQFIYSLIILVLFLLLVFKAKLKLTLISSLFIAISVFIAIFNLLGSTSFFHEKGCSDAVYQSGLSRDINYDVFVPTNNRLIYQRIATWEDVNGTILVRISNNEELLKQDQKLELVKCSVEAAVDSYGDYDIEQIDF